MEIMRIALGRRLGLTLTTIAATLLATLVGVQVAGAAQAGGALDSGFGKGGRALANFGKADPNRMNVDVTVASDGRGGALLTGTSRLLGGRVTAARLLEDGSLDPGFGRGGLLTLPGYNRLKLGNDGSLYQLGSIGNGDPGTDAAIRKLLPDGSVDPTFGVEGRVRTDLGFRESFRHLFIQPDGTIVAFGSFSCGATSCGFTFTRSFIARYSPSGQLLGVTKPRAEALVSVTMLPEGEFVASGYDSEMEISVLMRIAADGTVTSRVTSDYETLFKADAVAPQSDGKIVSFGWRDELVRLLSDDRTPDPSFDGTLPECPNSLGHFGLKLEVIPADRILVSEDCGIARFEADGTIDPTFGDNGIVRSDGDWPSMSIAGTPDGKVLASGWNNESGALVVHRLNPDGSPDETFANGGVATVPISAGSRDVSKAIALGPGGRPIAAGSTDCLGHDCGSLALSRFSSEGELDSSFGENGWVTSRNGGLVNAKAVATSPDGSVVAGGNAASNSFGLARFLRSGEPDPAFGDGGLVTTEVSAKAQARRSLNALALQKDGRIIAAGNSEGCGSFCFTVARYTPDGELDRSFGTNGLVRRSLPRVESFPSARAIAVQKNGRIVIAGGAEGYMVTVRLNRDGSFDRSFRGNGVALIKRSYRSNGKRKPDPRAKATSIAIDGKSRITIGGTGIRTGSLFHRFRGNGRIDRSFGRAGRVAVSGLKVSDIALARCGLFAIGNKFRSRSDRSMGLVAMAKNGPRKGRTSRVRHPFGLKNESSGAGLATTDSRRSIVLAGSFAKYRLGDDFALAKYRTSKLMKNCRR